MLPCNIIFVNLILIGSRCAMFSLATFLEQTTTTVWKSVYRAIQVSGHQSLLYIHQTDEQSYAVLQLQDCRATENQLLQFILYTYLSSSKLQCHSYCTNNIQCMRIDKQMSTDITSDDLPSDANFVLTCTIWIIVQGYIDGLFSNSKWGPLEQKSLPYDDSSIKPSTISNPYKVNVAKVMKLTSIIATSNFINLWFGSCSYGIVIVTHIVTIMVTCWRAWGLGPLVCNTTWCYLALVISL